MSELYKHFSRDWNNLDYSEESLIELYEQESFGKGTCKPNNGYDVGKKWLNVNVSMWKEDLERGYLFKWELYEDPKLPDWWLDKVLRC